MSVSQRAVLVIGALSIVVLATVAMFTNAPGEVIADARYEHVAEPSQFLERHSSVWDDERSLGAPTKYFSPVVPVFQSAAQQAGAEPWEIQRLTHALYVTLAGIGCLLLARATTGESNVAVLAGMLYAFNPFSSQFLLPSGLFVGYVVAPWLALATMRGLRPRADRWRWAAAVALAVFAMGAVNVPSLVLALFPAIGLGLLELTSGPSPVRRALGFGWRTALLTGTAAAPMVLTLALGSESLRVNLQTTETPELVAVSSSASETWRGLGFWLSYARFGGAQVRDQAIPFFTNSAVIACTFVIVLVAAVGLVARGGRRVAALALTAAVTVVVMVGMYPPSDSTPFGSLLGTAFDESLTLRGFRSLYKAGPGLQVPLAVLGAIGCAGLVQRVRADRRGSQLAGRGLVLATLVIALAVASFPFWTGGLYPSADRHEALPDYWTEAFGWFESQPLDEGVLILPSAARTDYRWGFVNDTLFDAHLPQPAVSARTLPQSTAALADLTESIEEYAASSGARPGVLASILRPMGVRWVLLQNDMAWFTAGVPRPAQYEFVRDDPDFELVAAFGEPGQNVVSRVARERATLTEAKLPPVEVYELVDKPASDGTRFGSFVVVEGSGDSWPSLAREGWLDHAVVYAGDADTAGRSQMLQAASAYVITDGSQRRAQRVSMAQSVRSHILAVGEDVGREVLNLFDDPRRQTVAERGNVAAAEATHFGRAFVVWERMWRPANALDGDRGTAWASDIGPSQDLSIGLEVPTVLSRIELTPFAEVEDGLDSVTVRLMFQGDEVAVYEPEVGGGDAVIDVAERELKVEGIVVTVRRSNGAEGLVGLAEVSLTGADGPLDTVEVLRVPGPETVDDEAALIDDLGSTPVHHVFSRLIGREEQPEEVVMRRRFWSPEGDSELSALVRVDQSTPEESIDALIDARVSVTSSGRYLGAVSASAQNLLDGRIATAWQFDPADPQEATITLPATELDQVQVWAIAESGLPFQLSRMTEVSVRLVDDRGAETVERVALDDAPQCDPSFVRFGDDVCVERITVDFEPMTVVEVSIESAEIVEEAGLFSPAPVQVADVRLIRDGAHVLDDGDVAPSDGCRPMLTLDGSPIELRPLASSGLDALADGVWFVGCDPVRLSNGWHRLDGLDGTANALEGIALAPAGAADEAAVETHGLIGHLQTSSKREVSTAVEGGDLVVTDVPAHRGWSLAVDGAPGSRVTANGFVGWLASGSGEATIELTFDPQKRYRQAWLISAASLAVCVWLLVPWRRLRP